MDYLRSLEKNRLEIRRFCRLSRSYDFTGARLDMYGGTDTTNPKYIPFGTIGTVAKVGLADSKNKRTSASRSIWIPVYWTVYIPHRKGPGPGSVPWPSLYLALPPECSKTVMKASLTILPTFVATFENSFWTLPGSMYKDNGWATGCLNR